MPEKKYETIRLSNHARKRMRQRNIPRNQILRTLNEPDRRYESGDELVAELSTAAGNVIQVIYVEGPEELLRGTDAYVVSLVRRSGAGKRGT